MVVSFVQTPPPVVVLRYAIVPATGSFPYDWSDAEDLVNVAESISKTNISCLVPASCMPPFRFSGEEQHSHYSLGLVPIAHPFRGSLWVAVTEAEERIAAAKDSQGR
jgi:hypothetical protein